MIRSPPKFVGDRAMMSATLVEHCQARWIRDHPNASWLNAPEGHSVFDAALGSADAQESATTEWLARNFAVGLWDGTINDTSALECARDISFEFAQEHLLLALERRGHGAQREVFCVTAKPWRWQAISNLSMFLGCPVRLQISDPARLALEIGRVYQRRKAEMDPVESVQPIISATAPRLEVELERWKDRDLLASAGKEPVARLVDAMLFDATERRASDVHIHPHADRLIVRYRIDGVLYNIHDFPPAVQDQIVGRVKVLAGMDVAEKRSPQDGRTSVQIGPRVIDMRISSLPTTCGERIVIRLLEQTAKLKRLPELGLPAAIQEQFTVALNRSHGLILVTGPTGSGKTTTLYSALAQLDSGEKNILTIEDPVEYQLEGISQTQVAQKKGLTFLNGLRHILRQDPDVILIGEIRDEDTARMVIQSSLTGHLVLSTLHTNTAAGAVARLADLGIEPFLIASSLLGVLAQRLVRRRCVVCDGPSDPTLAITSKKCAACGGTGYAGRLGLFEWLPVTHAIRNQIMHDLSAEKLEQLAVNHGMQRLQEQGRLLVEEGITTADEMMRVLGEKEPEA
jgi:general secretion pathway protein E